MPSGHITYSIRQFLPTEVVEYKAIRLEALQTEPGLYGNTYAMEAALPGAEWEQRITGAGQARFGLYANDELVGLTGIIKYKNMDDVGYMTQSYIRRQHRGKKLSRMLYEARIGWARAHGVKRLVISHKASNLASKMANQRFGFNYTHSEPRNWPDGTTENNLYYELILE